MVHLFFWKQNIMRFLIQFPKNALITLSLGQIHYPTGRFHGKNTAEFLSLNAFYLITATWLKFLLQPRLDRQTIACLCLIILMEYLPTIWWEPRKGAPISKNLSCCCIWLCLAFGFPKGGNKKYQENDKYLFWPVNPMLRKIFFFFHKQ